MYNAHILKWICYFEEIFFTGWPESCWKDNFPCIFYWVAWKLSKGQLSVHPVMKIVSKLHFGFSVWWGFTEPCLCKPHFMREVHVHQDELLSDRVINVTVTGLIPRHQQSLSWWRHQNHISMLLALCAGNSPVTGEFPTQRPMTQSFHVFFGLLLNKRWSKQQWGWWFETPSHLLWLQCNVNDHHPYFADWFQSMMGFKLYA